MVGLGEQERDVVYIEVGVSLILWGLSGAAVFRWYAEEEASEQGLPWSEAKEEPPRVGLKSNH